MTPEEIIDAAHKHLLLDDVEERIVAGDEYFETLDRLCDPELAEHIFQ